MKTEQQEREETERLQEKLRTPKLDPGRRLLLELIRSSK
jgi:hypothetical protein